MAVLRGALAEAARGAAVAVSTRARVGVAVTGFVAAIAVLCGCAPGPVGTAAQAPAGGEPGAALLGQLRIAPEDPQAPYSAKIRKAEWGDGWDGRGHGCDTREVVLARQNEGQIRVGPECRQECVSKDACWMSPYDGVSTRDAAALEIDHIVPIAEAARSPVVGSGPAGDAAVPAAIAWSRAEKHTFYEDLDNLVAVSSKANGVKSDGDPAEWKPDERSYWCEYATRYTRNKVRWGLSADQAEYDALARMFRMCSTTRGSD